MEPFDPDFTISPKQLSSSIAFCAISPIESLVWLSILLILFSVFSQDCALNSSAFESISAHSCLTFISVSFEMRISPIPMENPCPANHR